MPEGTHDGPPQVKIKPIDVEADEIQNFQIPSFVNYVNAWLYHKDVYVDMGLLTVEQMAEFKPESDREVKVAMYGRFVMSPITFEELLARMSVLREQLRSQEPVQKEAFDTPKTA